MNPSPLFASAALVLLALSPGAASAQRAPQPSPQIPSVELFTAPNFQGERLQLTATARNLDRTRFNDRAQSVRVTGTWTFCEDSDFDDYCQTLSRDEPDLGAIGLANAISSVRLETVRGGPEPSRPLPPPPPPIDGGDVLEGSTATFFALPSRNGRPIPACERGGRTSDCARYGADQFCRSEGYAGSAYFHVRYGRRGQILEDVLCTH